MKKDKFMLNEKWNFDLTIKANLNSLRVVYKLILPLIISQESPLRSSYVESTQDPLVALEKLKQVRTKLHFS